jgi:hypothetical protein
MKINTYAVNAHSDKQLRKGRFQKNSREKNTGLIDRYFYLPRNSCYFFTLSKRTLLIAPRQILNVSGFLGQ